MGLKASMIIIKQPSAVHSDEELLTKIGFTNIRISGNTTLDQCIYPKDRSINIGRYNDCIIITDDYQLTDSLERSSEPHLLSNYEKTLAELYPGSEILTVACHSVVNYHLYSLILNDQKLRFKKVTAENPTLEYGNRLEEEETIYAHSQVIDGQRMFKGIDENSYEYSEDQMLEDFVCGIAQRHLGVMILTEEDEELMFETPFKKYYANRLKKKASESSQKTMFSWLSKLFKNS